MGHEPGSRALPLVCPEGRKRVLKGAEHKTSEGETREREVRDI